MITVVDNRKPLLRASMRAANLKPGVIFETTTGFWAPHGLRVFIALTGNGDILYLYHLGEQGFSSNRWVAITGEHVHTIINDYRELDAEIIIKDKAPHA